MSTQVLTQSSPASFSDGGDVGNNFTPSAHPTSRTKGLKERIRNHYEKAAQCYQIYWGEHIHHGYFKAVDDTKDAAQLNLVELLLEQSQLERGSSVLDVGCGLGGCDRHLAKFWDCRITGIAISGREIQIAKKLAAEEAFTSPKGMLCTENFQLGRGEVCYLELDAEKLGDYFGFSAEPTTFQGIWIVETMSQIPDKDLLFRNAELLLDHGGKLIIADWFKADDLTLEQMNSDVKPIEDGMSLPPVCTQSDYVKMADRAGLKLFSPPLDISKEVSKTWDLGLSLVQNPTLGAFAHNQGWDTVTFLNAFRTMKRGYANGSFRYYVMAFEKDGQPIGEMGI